MAFHKEQKKREQTWPRCLIFSFHSKHCETFARHPKTDQNNSHFLYIRMLYISVCGLCISKCNECASLLIHILWTATTTAKRKIQKETEKRPKTQTDMNTMGEWMRNKRKSVELQKKRNARTRMNFYVDFLFIRICIIFILRFRLLLFLFNFVHLFRMHSIIRVIVPSVPRCDDRMYFF